MKYGRHTAAVEDIVAFVERGPLLVPSHRRPRGIIAIQDYRRAQKMAWEDTHSQGYTWNDIREDAAGNILGESYGIVGFKAVDAALGGLLKRFASRLAERLTGRYAKLVDDVQGDLYNCAYGRAVHGVRESFFETLYLAYIAGGWPCGMEEDGRNRRVVAFFPQGDATEGTRHGEEDGLDEEGLDESDTPPRVIGEICSRIGRAYGGFFAMRVGQSDGKPCMSVMFHVADKRRRRVAPATRALFSGTGIVYTALVGPHRTVVLDNRGRTVGSFEDITLDMLECCGDGGLEGPPPPKVEVSGRGVAGKRGGGKKGA